MRRNGQEGPAGPRGMSALIRDRYGVEVEAADETAVMVLDEAVHTLVGLEGDPVAAISAAADSGLVLARCLRDVAARVLPA